MALFPYNYVERNYNTNKITIEQENQLLTDFEDLTNNIITRCNLVYLSTIPFVNLRKQSDSGTALTAEDYDYNMTTLETTFNLIIFHAQSCGLNPTNTVSLLKRAVLDRPLYIQERDTNCSTIEVFLNSTNQLFVWAGV